MTEHKICTKCLLCKPIKDFYKNKKSKDGFRSNCIQCGNEYKVNNKDKIKEQIKKYNLKRNGQKKEWANQNKSKIKDSRKKWLLKNSENRLEYLKEYNKEYYKKNKETRLEYSKIKQKEYRKTNPLYKLKSNLRRRINRYLTSKSKSTEQILGINYNDFIIYFEKKFTDGMSWENQGRWHIDHIIPLSYAKTQEELIKLCHYTNLQPLWSKDNLKKSNKLDYLYLNR